MSAELSPSAVDLRAGVLRHLDSLAVPDAPYGRYRYGAGCPPTYWASAFVAMARHLLGDLSRLSEAERASWRDYLIAGQDERSGLFIDPAFRSEERISAAHSDELLHWHSATFILTAIELLGGRPRYPIAAVHPLLSPPAMEAFIEQLPWQVTPWVVGNWTYDIGCLVGHDWRITGSAANLEAMEAFFRWHERHQRADTGWWDLTGRFGVDHQQYGGYHTLMVYWMYDRPVPHPELMIDSSLTLQTAEGHFGGGCCPDMDVVDATVSLSRQYGIREREVAGAMERALPWLLAHQLPGGGFIDRRGHGRNEFGWRACQVEVGEADPCSDFFRAFSVALCAEVLPGTGFEQLPWRHHGTCGHGVRPRVLREATSPGG